VMMADGDVDSVGPAPPLRKAWPTNQRVPVALATLVGGVSGSTWERAMGGVVGEGVSDGVGDAEADMDGVAVKVVDVEGEVVLVVETEDEQDCDPVREAVRLADEVGELVGERDGVMLGVTLGDGVGQGTEAVSDIMVFMRRSTRLVCSLVNSSPASVRAAP